MQKVMIFVDQSNYFYAAKARGRFADLVKLRDYLANSDKGRALVEMVVYIGFPPERSDMPQRWEEVKERMYRLRERLEYDGIMTVSHIGKQSNDTDTGFTANVDILMAMDALEFAIDVRPDVVVLVTGDGDFAYLANKLRRKGIRVEAASLENTISGNLKKSVNSFIDLDEFFRTLDGPPIGGTDEFFD